ncbi:MAG: hypothetical protein KJ971_08425 [Firmicutes bacterium]|nr:hypothetical protein [Bacillota bacterium]
MKKILMILFILISISTFSIHVEAQLIFDDLKSDIDYEQIVHEKESFNETFYYQGQVVASQEINKQQYEKKLEMQKQTIAEKETLQRQKALGMELTAEENALLDNTVMTLAVDLYGVYHNPIVDKVCYTNTYMCGAVAVYDEVSYSIHYTTVILFPNRSTSLDIDNNPATQTPTGYIHSKLIWNDALPSQRHTDYISVEWDSDDFSDITSSIKGTITNEYTESEPVYLFYIGGIGFFLIDYNDYSYTKVHNYTMASNPTMFNHSESGIVFGAPLMDDIEYPVDPLTNPIADYTNVDDPFPTPLSCTYVRHVNKITVELRSDIIYDHGTTINPLTLSNTQFAGDYIHYYKKFSIDISVSSSITVTGVNAGITLSPTITDEIDMHRLNKIQFFFNTSTSGC